MRKARWTAAGLLLLLATGHPRAGEVPWAQVPGADALNGAQREVMEEVLSGAPCYGPCRGTLLSCLGETPVDPIARRLAAFAVRRVRADRDAEEILKEIENRRISAFPPKTFAPDLQKTPMCGSPKARVRIVLYADFGCPYCKATATALRALVRENPERVAFYFKNYPLKANERAVPAALALLAAERQGKFWEMHDLLFAGDDDLSDAYFDASATKLGLDLGRFHADMKGKAAVDRIRAEKMEAIQYGVERTPGILVNGKVYRGVRTWEELSDRIDEEYDLLGPAK